MERSSPHGKKIQSTSSEEKSENQNLNYYWDLFYDEMPTNKNINLFDQVPISYLNNCCGNIMAYNFDPIRLSEFIQEDGSYKCPCNNYTTDCYNCLLNHMLFFCKKICQIHNELKANPSHHRIYNGYIFMYKFQQEVGHILTIKRLHKDQGSPDS